MHSAASTQTSDVVYILVAAAVVELNVALIVLYRKSGNLHLLLCAPQLRFLCESTFTKCMCGYTSSGTYNSQYG